MKKLFAVIMFLMMAFAPKVNAQVRWQVGTKGGQDFDNSSVGFVGAVEAPFAKHYEFDLSDTFSPIESHVSLGGGRANIIEASGYVWFGSKFGVTGGAEDSMYDVTKVTKDADYAFGGVAYRGIVGGAPTRFTFEYIRQFNNGVTPTGLESSHLQGFSLGYTMRFGCIGDMCIRTSEDFVAGAVLTQGNEACDGSLPIVPPNIYCGPRTRAFGGGVTASITLEFPRRRGHEKDVF